MSGSERLCEIANTLLVLGRGGGLAHEFYEFSALILSKGGTYDVNKVLGQDVS